MATITINEEAYRLLAAEKKKGESFSRLIKRRLGPKQTRAQAHGSGPTGAPERDQLQRRDARPGGRGHRLAQGIDDGVSNP